MTTSNIHGVHFNKNPYIAEEARAKLASSFKTVATSKYHYVNKETCEVESTDVWHRVYEWCKGLLYDWTGGMLGSQDMCNKKLVNLYLMREINLLSEAGPLDSETLKNIEAVAQAQNLYFPVVNHGTVPKPREHESITQFFKKIIENPSNQSEPTENEKDIRNYYDANENELKKYLTKQEINHFFINTVYQPPLSDKEQENLDGDKPPKDAESDLGQGLNQDSNPNQTLNEQPDPTHKPQDSASVDLEDPSLDIEPSADLAQHSYAWWPSQKTLMGIGALGIATITAATAYFTKGENNLNIGKETGSEILEFEQPSLHNISPFNNVTVFDIIPNNGPLNILPPLELVDPTELLIDPTGEQNYNDTLQEIQAHLYQNQTLPFEEVMAPQVVIPPQAMGGTEANNNNKTETVYDTAKEIYNYAYGTVAAFGIGLLSWKARQKSETSAQSSEFAESNSPLSPAEGIEQVQSPPADPQTTKERLRQLIDDIPAGMLEKALSNPSKLGSHESEIIEAIHKIYEIYEKLPLDDGTPLTNEQNSLLVELRTNYEILYERDLPSLTKNLEASSPVEIIKAEPLLPLTSLAVQPPLEPSVQSVTNEVAPPNEILPSVEPSKEITPSEQVKSVLEEEIPSSKPVSPFSPIEMIIENLTYKVNHFKEEIAIQENYLGKLGKLKEEAKKNLDAAQTERNKAQAERDENIANQSKKGVHPLVIPKEIEKKVTAATRTLNKANKVCNDLERQNPNQVIAQKQAEIDKTNQEISVLQQMLKDLETLPSKILSDQQNRLEELKKEAQKHSENILKKELNAIHTIPSQYSSLKKLKEEYLQSLTKIEENVETIRAHKRMKYAEEFVAILKKDLKNLSKNILKATDISADELIQTFEERIQPPKNITAAPSYFLSLEDIIKDFEKNIEEFEKDIQIQKDYSGKLLSLQTEAKEALAVAEKDFKTAQDEQDRYAQRGQNVPSAVKTKLTVATRNKIRKQKAYDNLIQQDPGKRIKTIQGNIAKEKILIAIIQKRLAAREIVNDQLEKFIESEKVQAQKAVKHKKFEYIEEVIDQLENGLEELSAQMQEADESSLSSNLEGFYQDIQTFQLDTNNEVASLRSSVELNLANYPGASDAPSVFLEQLSRTTIGNFDDSLSSKLVNSLQSLKDANQENKEHINELEEHLEFLKKLVASQTSSSHSSSSSESDQASYSSSSLQNNEISHSSEKDQTSPSSSSSESEEVKRSSVVPEQSSEEEVSKTTISPQESPESIVSSSRITTATVQSVLRNKAQERLKKLEESDLPISQFSSPVEVENNLQPGTGTVWQATEDTELKYNHLDSHATSVPLGTFITTICTNENEVVHIDLGTNPSREKVKELIEKLEENLSTTFTKVNSEPVGRVKIPERPKKAPLDILEQLRVNSFPVYGSLKSEKEVEQLVKEPLKALLWVKEPSNDEEVPTSHISFLQGSNLMTQPGFPLNIYAFRGSGYEFILPQESRPTKDKYALLGVTPESSRREITLAFLAKQTKLKIDSSMQDQKEKLESAYKELLNFEEQLRQSTQVARDHQQILLPGFGHLDSKEKVESLLKKPYQAILWTNTHNQIPYITSKNINGEIQHFMTLPNDHLPSIIDDMRHRGFHFLSPVDSDYELLEASPEMTDHEINIQYLKTRNTSTTHPYLLKTAFQNITKYRAEIQENHIRYSNGLASRLEQQGYPCLGVFSSGKFLDEKLHDGQAVLWIEELTSKVHIAVKDSSISEDVLHRSFPEYSLEANFSYYGKYTFLGKYGDLFRIEPLPAIYTTMGLQKSDLDNKSTSDILTFLGTTFRRVSAKTHPDRFKSEETLKTHKRDANETDEQYISRLTELQKELVSAYEQLRAYYEARS